MPYRSLKAHKGHVTVVSTWPPASSSSSSSDSTLFLSGGQDGLLRVWDTRCETCVHKVECHTSARSGTGAVSCVEVTDSLVITAGADKRICVLEPRNGFGMLHQLEEHADFIYSLHAPPAGGVVFSGAGNGMVLCHSLVEGRALYGMGANQGAVRCLATQGEHMVAAGDDGKCLMYDY
jgi:F-box/WD-40 domain protein 7